MYRSDSLNSKGCCIITKQKLKEIMREREGRDRVRVRESEREREREREIE